jgi:hypothetical protein
VISWGWIVGGYFVRCAVGKQSPSDADSCPGCCAARRFCGVMRC